MKPRIPTDTELIDILNHVHRPQGPLLSGDTAQYSIKITASNTIIEPTFRMALFAAAGFVDFDLYVALPTKTDRLMSWLRNFAIQRPLASALLVALPSAMLPLAAWLYDVDSVAIWLASAHWVALANIYYFVWAKPMQREELRKIIKRLE